MPITGLELSEIDNCLNAIKSLKDLCDENNINFQVLNKIVKGFV